jgi:hypothetical protein
MRSGRTESVAKMIRIHSDLSGFENRTVQPANFEEAGGIAVIAYMEIVEGVEAFAKQSGHRI